MKYIGASSVSTEKIDIKCAASKVVVVTNIASYCDNGVAEFVLAFHMGKLQALNQNKVIQILELNI